MKPNIEERSKELLENLKWLDSEAKRRVEYSRRLSQKLGVNLFLEMAKNSKGAISGPYWRTTYKYLKRDKFTGTPKEKKGSTHFKKSITRGDLVKIKRIRKDNVEKLMELNEQAKGLRGMRRAMTDAKTRVARSLQSANELHKDMWANYNLSMFKDLNEQIANYEGNRNRAKPKAKKGGVKEA
jgi:hypothetical protein